MAVRKKLYSSSNRKILASMHYPHTEWLRFSVASAAAAHPPHAMQLLLVGLQIDLALARKSMSQYNSPLFHQIRARDIRPNKGSRKFSLYFALTYSACIVTAAVVDVSRHQHFLPL